MNPQSVTTTLSIATTRSIRTLFPNSVLQTNCTKLKWSSFFISLEDVLRVYKESHCFTRPLTLAFLCGTKYDSANENDKRKILKKFLQSNISDCRALILEENFGFTKTTEKYLSYDEIFLRDLAQIEQMASLYADKIIVVHESLSTAAEIGVFASDPSVAPRVCVLVPDENAIDENKISGFIYLAFLADAVKKNKIGKEIRFYPDVRVHRISGEKSDYYTYFHNNEIGDRLGRKIIDFICSKKKERTIRFKQNKYRSHTADPDNIDFFIDGENKEVRLYISANTLKYQLISMLQLDDIEAELEKHKKIHEHVTYITHEIKKILLDTISSMCGYNLSSFNLTIKIKDDTACSFNQAVGLFVFMMQAIGGIKMEPDSGDETLRNIKVANTLRKYKSALSGYLYDKKESKYGKMRI